LHRAEKQVFPLFMQIDPDDIRPFQHFIAQARKVRTGNKTCRKNKNQSAAWLQPLETPCQEQCVQIGVAAYVDLPLILQQRCSALCADLSIGRVANDKVKASATALIKRIGTMHDTRPASNRKSVFARQHVTKQCLRQCCETGIDFDSMHILQRALAGILYGEASFNALVHQIADYGCDKRTAAARGV
jgi:hypothetical protein